MVFWGGLGLLVLGLVWSFRPQPVAVDLAEVARGRLSVTVDEEGETRARQQFGLSTPWFARASSTSKWATVVASETGGELVEPHQPTPLNHLAWAGRRRDILPAGAIQEVRGGTDLGAAARTARRGVRRDRHGREGLPPAAPRSGEILPAALLATDLREWRRVKAARRGRVPSWCSFVPGARCAMFGPGIV